MPFVGEAALPSPTLDHQMTTFDATEKLIILGKDYAFVERDGEYIGIVSLVNIMEDASDSNLTEFMEPLFFVKADDHKLKAAALMQENNVEHIAVTNQAGEFVGITSAKRLQEEL